MQDNPYQAPSVHASEPELPVIAEPVEHDILSVPAALILVPSALLMLVTGAVVVGVVFRLLRGEDLILPNVIGTVLFVQSLLLFFGTTAIVHRRRRWLVLVSCVAGLTTCMAPISAIILMRLWRKDVWYSFK